MGQAGTPPPAGRPRRDPCRRTPPMQPCSQTQLHPAAPSCTRTWSLSRKPPAASAASPATRPTDTSSLVAAGPLCGPGPPCCCPCCCCPCCSACCCTEAKAADGRGCPCACCCCCCCPRACCRAAAGPSPASSSLLLLLPVPRLGGRPLQREKITDASGSGEASEIVPAHAQWPQAAAAAHLDGGQNHLRTSTTVHSPCSSSSMKTHSDCSRTAARTARRGTHVRAPPARSAGAGAFAVLRRTLRAAPAACGSRKAAARPRGEANPWQGERRVGNPVSSPVAIEEFLGGARCI